MRKFFTRKLVLLLSALMLGMSNVILEEQRSVNDTRPKIEQAVIELEDD